MSRKKSQKLQNFIDSSSDKFDSLVKKSGTRLGLHLMNSSENSQYNKFFTDKKQLTTKQSNTGVNQAHFHMHEDTALKIVGEDQEGEKQDSFVVLRSGNQQRHQESIFIECIDKQSDSNEILLGEDGVNNTTSELEEEAESPSSLVQVKQNSSPMLSQDQAKHLLNNS